MHINTFFKNTIFGRMLPFILFIGFLVNTAFYSSPSKTTNPTQEDVVPINITEGIYGRLMNVSDVAAESDTPIHALLLVFEKDSFLDLIDEKNITAENVSRRSGNFVLNRLEFQNHISKYLITDKSTGAYEISLEKGSYYLCLSTFNPNNINNSNIPHSLSVYGCLFVSITNENPLLKKNIFKTEMNLY